MKDLRTFQGLVRTRRRIEWGIAPIERDEVIIILERPMAFVGDDIPRAAQRYRANGRPTYGVITVTSDGNIQQRFFAHECSITSDPDDYFEVCEPVPSGTKKKKRKGKKK